MSTSYKYEAGVDKPTNEHPVAFGALTLLAEHRASKILSDEVLACYLCGIK